MRNIQNTLIGTKKSKYKLQYNEFHQKHMLFSDRAIILNSDFKNVNIHQPQYVHQLQIWLDDWKNFNGSYKSQFIQLTQQQLSFQVIQKCLNAVYNSDKSALLLGISKEGQNGLILNSYMKSIWMKDLKDIYSTLLGRQQELPLQIKFLLVATKVSEGKYIHIKGRYVIVLYVKKIRPIQNVSFIAKQNKQKEVKQIKQIYKFIHQKNKKYANNDFSNQKFYKQSCQSPINILEQTITVPYGQKIIQDMPTDIRKEAKLLLIYLGKIFNQEQIANLRNRVRITEFRLISEIERISLFEVNYYQCDDINNFFTVHHQEYHECCEIIKVEKKLKIHWRNLTSQFYDNFLKARKFKPHQFQIDPDQRITLVQVNGKSIHRLVSIYSDLLSTIPNQLEQLVQTYSINRFLQFINQA